MEDVIEKLCEFNELVLVFLELLEEELLVEIEEELLIGIFVEFCEFFLLVSDVVYGCLELVIVIDLYLYIYLFEVVVIVWDLGVLCELILFCEDDGSYYCVVEDGEVVFWVDGDFIDESWDLVWVWVCDVWLES